MLGRLGQNAGQRNNAEQKRDIQEALRHNDLIAQLKLMVKEKDEKVQELEQEIQQLTLKVNTHAHKLLRFSIKFTEVME